MSEISIVIVDDHPVVLEGLFAMLSVEPTVKVVGTFGSATAALEAIPTLKPDVVLADLSLPDMAGADLIAAICSFSSDIQVVVITSNFGDEAIYRALGAGARGYLFKDSARKDLIQAIHAVHAGQRFIPPAVGARLAEHMAHTVLSPREVEVLRLVSVGSRNKEISWKLGISEATVNAHVKHIMQKLNATDRTEAVTIALRRSIISL